MCAGMTLMAFLVGPPDRGRGCVLRRKPAKPAYLPPAMTEITYTSLALGMQPAPLLPTHSSSKTDVDSSNQPAEVSGPGALTTLLESVNIQPHCMTCLHPWEAMYSQASSIGMWMMHVQRHCMHRAPNMLGCLCQDLEGMRPGILVCCCIDH